MDLIIKDWHSSDMDQFWLWQPNEEDAINLNIEVSIGRRSLVSSTIFNFALLSCDAVSRNAKFESLLFGRGYIIVDPKLYTFALLEKRITNLVDVANTNIADSLDAAYRFIDHYIIWEYSSIATL